MSDTVDEPWTTTEVLAQVSLTAEGAVRGSDPTIGGQRQAAVTLGRPLVYPVSPEELSVPLRRRAENAGVRFVGTLWPIELDELPRGRAYTALCLMVSLPGAGYRAVSLRADQEAMELLDGGTEVVTAPVPSGLRRLMACRPSRLGRLGRPMSVLDSADGRRHASADTRASGLSTERFSWAVDAPGGGRLAERTFVAHALVEAPAEADELTGRLSCRVTVRRSMGRFVRLVEAVMTEATPFAERIGGLQPPPVDLGRAVRLVISIDLRGYGRHDPGGTERAQRRLAEVLERARTATGVASEDRQEGGDSVMFVFPPGIDEGAVLRRFYAELVSAVSTMNVDLGDHAALRLRVGIDRGLTQRAGTGWSGPVPTTVTRLRDAPPARDALAGSPSAHLVFTVSDVIYRDVFSERGRVPAADSFRRVEVDIPEKNFNTTAWIHVPVPGVRS